MLRASIDSLIPSNFLQGPYLPSDWAKSYIVTSRLSGSSAPYYSRPIKGTWATEGGGEFRLLRTVRWQERDELFRMTCTSTSKLSARPPKAINPIAERLRTEDPSRGLIGLLKAGGPPVVSSYTWALTR